MDNLDFLYSLFNQYTFQTAKNSIKEIEYYFSTNPNTATSPLVKELVSAIKNYDLDAIGAPLFQSILMRCNKSQEESQQIMGDIIRWKSYSKEQMKPTTKYLNDIVAASVIQKANQLYKQSPSEYLKYLKTANYQTADLDTFSSVTFDKIDINSIIAESSKGSVSTNVRFINDAFAPHNGIERGQLGILCAPPGVGKTLFAMNLALWMASHGEKVLYVSLADMTAKDYIVRMGSIAFGIPFAEAYRNLGSVYEQLKRLLGDNLEISINPAGTVSADDIIERVLNSDCSVVFIDYDGVLEGATEGDSMYNTFGEIYNNLTKISLAGKLGFICAQPKVFVYDKMIGLADIGESSRKQQVVDFAITISNVNPECPNHLYVMSLPKARRGRVGAKCYVIRVNGRFKEIPKGVYEVLRQETEEIEYTEAEIDRMINAYNAQQGRIQQNLQTAQAQHQAQTQGKQPNNLQTPFTI